MNNNSKEKVCEFCNEPLQREINSNGYEYLICTNSKCLALRLTRLETRLGSIEKHLLEIIPKTKEKVVKLPEKVESPIESKVKQISSVKIDIQNLSNLSLKDGKVRFYSLQRQLKGSRDRLEFFLEQVANKEFSSPQHLRQWAILMAYSGKPFTTALRVMKVGGSKEYMLLEEIIDRANSVRTIEQEKIVPKQFYQNLVFRSTKDGLLPEITINFLRIKLDKDFTPIEQTKEPEKIVAKKKAPFYQPIKRTEKEAAPSPNISWIDRFRPEEGWEFAIGANWLRWVGVGTILLALFLLVSWSTSQLELTEEQTSYLEFIGIIVIGGIIHYSSFYVRRIKERKVYHLPIAYSLAFLALGIYYIAIFALRFHPSSPVFGDEFLHIYLCILLITISVVTAWRHNSSIVFIEGFGFVLWLIWHISTQNLLNNFDFSINILWFCYVIFILAFLGIAYVRKDTVLTTSTQFLSLSLLFLPNSSEVFSSYNIIEELPDLNVTIVLLSVISIIYWIIGFKFPLDIAPQNYDLINRNHLSIATVTPVFASFFLLISKNITSSVFIPYLVIFAILFLSLTYIQKDLGTTFTLVVLIQLLWLISIDFLDNVLLVESIPEINGILFILAFLTFVYWLSAHKFPYDDVKPNFWDFIKRKHLSLAAIGPIFISFILAWFYYLDNSILVLFMILFCVLWSTDRNYRFNISSLTLQNVSSFDLATYISAVLFFILSTLRITDVNSIILGFIAFPLMLIIIQKYSEISLQDQEKQEASGITTIYFVSIIFLTITWKDMWIELGDSLSLFLSDWGIDISTIGLQYGHNWAFFGYVWLIIVSLITTIFFNNLIKQKSTKYLIVLSTPITLFVYMTMVQLPEIMALLFVFISYVQLLLFFELFVPKIESEKQSDSRFLLAALVLLQAIGFSLQLTTVIDMNVLVFILLNAVLPFSLGLFMAFRKRVDYLIDSYLIFSISVITFLQFFILDSNQLDYAWITQLSYLIIGLSYIYCRYFFTRKQLISNSTSPSILGSIYPNLTITNKEQIGVNILIFSTLGFINTTMCFIVFGADISPILIMLLYDSLIGIPFIFGLIFCGLKYRLATVNALTIYSVGMVLRLPVVYGFDLDYDLLLLVLMIVQVIIHYLLLSTNKSEEILEFEDHIWQLEFKGIKTWSQDSFRLISVLNPVFFYLFISELSGIFVSGNSFFETKSTLIIIIAVLVAIYFVSTTKSKVPLSISESGLFLSVFVIWFFTLSDLNLIYFSTASTAYLCIIYGFWANGREWRFLGIGFIGLSLLYSSIRVTELSSELERIIGFGILGIISFVIGYVYTRYANRFSIGRNESIG